MVIVAKKDEITKSYSYRNASIGESRDALIAGIIPKITPTATENTNAKVSIGTPTTAAPAAGILVLEDQTKAMVLPRVASPHLNIIDPAPGMMVYDTTAKQLAVFNGTVWSFWKQ